MKRRTWGVAVVTLVATLAATVMVGDLSAETKKKSSDRSKGVLSVPLKVNLRGTGPAASATYSLMGNAANLLKAVVEDGILKVTTKFGDGREGFVISHQALISGTGTFQTAVLPKTSLYSDRVEEIAGVSLAPAHLSIPPEKVESFLAGARAKGIPLGSDRYGFNFAGVDAEISWRIERGRIVEAELTYLDDPQAPRPSPLLGPAPATPKSYTDSKGNILPPRVIRLGEVAKQ